MELKEAVETLCKALETDEGYRMSWQANIAMAFKDEWSRRATKDEWDTRDVHTIANKAADNFLKLLCAFDGKD